MSYSTTLVFEPFIFPPFVLRIEEVEDTGPVILRTGP